MAPHPAPAPIADAASGRPRPRRGAAATALVAVVAMLTGLLTVLGVGALAPASTDAVAVLDDFERVDWPDPVLWPFATEGGWRPSSCQARRGAYGLRAFVPSAPDVPQPACEAPVAAGAQSRALLLLDLRGAEAANRLELHFDLWLRLNAGAPNAPSGLFLYLLLPDADAGAAGPTGAEQRVAIFGATGDAGRWAFPGRSLDLRNVVDVNDPSVVLDLRGKRWWLEWIASAPAGAPPGGGVFLDDLALVWEPDAVVPTPSPRPPPPPTATPTASSTPPPTASPTHTAIPTREPTASPPAVLYLPVTRRDPSPTPPPSATPDPDAPSATPSEPGPGTGTAAPSASPTSTVSPTTAPSATPTPVRRFLPRAVLERSMDGYPGPAPTASPSP